jgi:hypothetical protein
MPKIGEMTPERTNWGDSYYLPVFDTADPANPDPRISLGSLRTAAAELTNKTLGSGTAINVEPATTGNIGAPESGVAVGELGDGFRHKTTLTLADFPVGTSGDAVNLALGALLYTFPAGVILVRAVAVDVGVTIDDATQTDTPELGLGTAEAAGANATLGAAGATTENIFEGTALADVAGTALVAAKKATASPFELLIAEADDHTVYLNLADGWADFSAGKALTATGTITLLWDFIG